MSAEQPRASKPTWRDRSRGPSRPEESRHEWNRRARGESDGASLRRRVSPWIVVGVSAVVTVAALIILIYWTLGPVDSADVVLIGADYATNLEVPHNVYGVEGLKGIEALSTAPTRRPIFPSSSLRLVRDGQGAGRMPLERADEWENLIAKVGKTSRQRTIVLFVALHGFSDDNGAYLLPNQARAANDSDRLELGKVIDSMNRLPRDKNKVLILEGAQVPSDWRRGMLHNDFARRLKELEPAIAAIDHLWVLSGCDVDQRCWASEGLRRTIFSHYLIEGLNGAVARSGRAINLADLHRYVRENVRRWAWDARGALQEPVLLPTVGADGTPLDPEQLLRAARQVALSAPARISLPRPAAPPNLAARLEKAWRGYNRLANLVPHPAVYAPRRWRLYRAAIVRHEELMRAGDARQQVADLMTSLEREIRQDQHPSLPASSENTLVMNTLQGGATLGPRDTPEGFTQGFTRFWNALDSEFPKVWQDVKADLDRSSAGKRRPPVSSSVDDFLLSRAEDDPVRYLKKAADRVKITRKEDHFQPAEAHYLLMLDRHLGLKERPTTNAPLVAQALRVRRLAERSALGGTPREGSYPYSEQGLAWIQPIIEEADRERRRGEDLLFSTEAKDWEQAKAAFDKAKGSYEAADRRAGEIRSALATRDRVLSDLPDLTRWMAHRHSSDLDDDLLNVVQDLWGRAHVLAQKLEEPPADAAVEPLKRRAQEVADGFARVEKRFGNDKAIDGTRMPEDWETATAAASVAFTVDDSLPFRNSIGTRLANIGLNDVKLAESGKGGTFVPSDDHKQSDLDRARRRARVEGLMCLAALGRSWFDDPRFKEGDFDAAHRDIDAEEEPLKWWQTLAKVGRQAGQRWQKLSADADLGDARDESKVALGELRSSLRTADLLGRRADPGGLSPEEPTREAALRHRDLRVHDLLLWMARRNWLDHWSDLDTATHKPYYLVAGSKYVDDAQQLVPRSVETKEMRARLETKVGLGFDTPGLFVLTSEWEQAVPVKFRVVEEGDVPPGFPVVWPRPGPSLQVDGDDFGKRKPVRRAEDGQPGQPVAFSFRSPLLQEAERDPKLIRPRVEETSFDVVGLFRGREFLGRAGVRIHPMPETTVIGPPQPEKTANISVRAERAVIEKYGRGTGSIAIVLDCSGSMVPKEMDFRAQSKSKFEAAKNALISVLKTVPAGTTVSLYIFGQAREGFNPMLHRQEDVKDGQDPTRTIKPLLKKEAWDLGKLTGLRRQLDELKPLHWTPLVEAMSRAKTNFDQAEGLKTLLVLTDGADTVFERNLPPELRIQKIRASILKMFNKSAIMVNMVLLDVGAGDERERARAQFEDVLRRLDPPGQFITVQDLARLDQTLSNMLEQKLTCKITAADQTVSHDLDVMAPGEPDHWDKGLKPGIYNLSIRTDLLQEQQVELAPGDRLMVRVVAGAGGKLTFKRSLYSEDQPPERYQDGGGWRLAVLQNHATKEGEGPGGLQMRATLEPIEGVARLLRQPKPRLAWFELAPEEGRGAYAVRWRQLALYPAPVWQFDVPAWIGDPAGGVARPVLRAWWSPDQGPPIAAEVRFQDNPQKIPVGDGKDVWVESIRAEDHSVEVRPGAPPELQPCLVVRLSYPEGSPHWVEPKNLTGVQPTGFEHRSYTRAGKYTGLFWPVTRPQFEAGLQTMSLNLFSLSQFRGQAKDAGHTIEMTKLAQPAR